ncbi:MAG: hypothetical protein RL711_672 [Bacteroidota bacterium]|jgi:mRNA-degrading endonuclease HigB of HigAB toxin-antitoxin module
MCKVSDQIILCTCKAKSTESLKNYWSLHSFGNKTGLISVGEVLMSYYIIPDNYKEMQHQLLIKLNEGSIFDVVINIKKNDKLVIAICKTKFEFIFEGENWKHTEYDNFELENKYTKVNFGKIKKKK